jgi:hypothetical protein
VELLLLLAFFVPLLLVADDFRVVEERFTAELLVFRLEELLTVLLLLSDRFAGATELFLVVAVLALVELVEGFLSVLLLVAGSDLLAGWVWTADLFEFPSPLLILPLGDTGSVPLPRPWFLPTFFCGSFLEIP